jgi:small subunit ribosomal protein S4e
MHIKRHKIPKNSPIPRKGTTFVVRPSFGLSMGIPILILLRDVLKIAQNKREVKRAINKDYIMINNKILRDEKHPALLFDTLTLVPEKKHYRLNLNQNGKFNLEEIKDSEKNKKISKIINKRTLKGKKTQINLSDGLNLLSNEKCHVGDSVLIDLKKMKIEKCIELKEKAEVIVFAGKHSGKKGFIKEFIPQRKMARLNIEGKELNVLLRQLMVIK